MVLVRVLDWDDVIGNRAAWDTLIYFATLMALADGLNRVGDCHLGRAGRIEPVDRLIAVCLPSSSWCRSSSWSITCSPA